MKKRDSTSDRADGAEVSTTDTDAVQVAGADSDTAASSDTEAKSEPIAGSVSEAEPASQPALSTHGR